jgi:hypothetical protein
MREILARAKNNLNRAIENAGATNNLPSAGERWETYARAVRKHFRGLLTPLQAVHFAQNPHQHGGFELRETTEKLDDTVAERERFLTDEFPQFADQTRSFEESIFSDHKFLTFSHDRIVSGPMYEHTYLILQCLSQGRPEQIVEIGGGYGAAARLWMTNSAHKPKLYFDVDLPESLFFAENYLGLNFGGDSVLYLHTPDDLAKLSEPRLKFALCPTHCVELLRDLKFDLAWNSHSMSEMSEAYVDYYMRWLDQIRPGYFFSCNSFGYDLTKMDESVNFISPLPSDQWKMVYSRLRGNAPNWAAEMTFRSIPTSKDRVSEAKDLLSRNLTPQSFLTLLDATRGIENGDLIWKIIQKVELEFGYLPKEIVHLCRLVDRLGPSPSQEFDVFRNKVNRIANESPKGRVSAHLLKASIKEESRERAEVPIGMLQAGPNGLRATIQGRSYEISADYFGAVEEVKRQGKAIIVYGWAADTEKQNPVKTVYGFAGDDLVAVGEPTFGRDDIVAGWGEWSRNAGFRLRIPITDRPLTLIGLTEAGRAGRLKL